MNAWIPYLYQYGISAFLVAVVAVISIRTKALDLKRSDDARTLLFVILGFVFYAFLHGLWLYAAWRAL